LGQHHVNPAGWLHVALDEWNFYVLAKFGDEIGGFISIRRVFNEAALPG
jgi:hypothetical protein